MYKLVIDLYNKLIKMFMIVSKEDFPVYELTIEGLVKKGNNLS